MNKQFRRLALASLILGSTLSTTAATVALDEAQMIAAEFLSSMTGKAPETISLTPVATKGTKSTPLYYVFNNSNNQGFVIVSAESAAAPILGYSLDSNYPAEAAVPESMQWMLAGIEREIKVAPGQQNSQSMTSLRRMARSAAQSQGEQKLLSTPSWSQEAPFNSMIPGKPLVGCVGTAMATVMKYYNFPETGSGSFDGVDFNVAYDWNSMRTDNYRSGYSATEGDAVAQLMYHASKAIDTQYAMSGSSAYEVRVPGALSTYFGYDPGVSYKKRAEVSTQEAWDAIVKAEINEGRPVIYCGQDVTAGHAFVCDGYQGDYLHFNWGWGGSANGYFLSTALNPTVSRTHHYNNLNTIVYNIKPGTGEITKWSPIHITADGNQIGMGSDLTDLASGQKFTVRVGNLKNLSYDNFSGKIAVALFGKNGQMKALLSSEANFSMQSMGYLFDGYRDFRNCQLPSVVVPEADDMVCIATKAADSNEWLPVAGELYTTNSLPVSAPAPASFAINFPAGLAGVTVTGEPSVVRGWNYSFNVVPDNAADDVVTVKANGYVLNPGANYSYTIANVREDQTLNILVQKASEVKAKRSIWVETPGTLSTLISDQESGTIKELTLFGSIDARDFAFMRNSMRLTRVDISGCYIAAHGNDQANALPREAFRGAGTISEVILPKSLNRINNGAFRQCGITTITIPAGVKTYEYNVFVSATRLRDIYVGRETAEFINWCVLSGVKVAQCTLHVPTERALANYSKAENWKTIANIIVDPVKESDTVLFAVADNEEVMFDTNDTTGAVEKGKTVSFKATHIAENDNRMEVYANSTRLTPNADGVYTATINANTIIHFNLAAPTAVDKSKSPWTLTAANGSIGMFTDAVNVIPGQEFTIRFNAVNVPQYSEQFYWAVALTDASGNIKEFISPVTVWNAGVGKNFKMNVNCLVSDSKVREGNTIRLVTSANKKNWNLVAGADATITDALPALNNTCEVYRLNVTSKGNANITGLPETAVRGRDLTIKVTPASAAHRVNLSINGTPVAQGAASVNHTFVVMSDTEINLDVFDPKAEGTVTYNVQPGELYAAVTPTTIMPNVVVTGTVYSRDLSLAFRQDFAARTIKKLDLSGVTIVANVLTPTNEDDKIENYIPSNLLYNPSGVGAVMPVVQEILLPNSVTRIGEGAFTNCANLKEIRLPESLISDRIQVGTYASGSPKYGYSLSRKMFSGCTSLKTIYLPATPSTVNGRMVVSFYDPYASYANGVNSGNNVLDGSTALYDLGFWRNDKPDASDITLIVPEEYLSVYRTPYANSTYGNPWVAHKYNILSEKPVYGVNFDPSRVAVVDEANTNINELASFLGDNVPLTSMKAEGKIRLLNPEASALVYDNGELIQPNADGTIDIEFFNPAKDATKAGNHKIDVVYTYDVAFHSTSELFSIHTPEVANASGFATSTFDKTETTAPVLKTVAENSVVRFALDFNPEHADGLEGHVKVGTQELTPDEEGYYTLDVTNAGATVEIFAVPANGATLNSDEIASIDPSQTKDITDITLTGSLSDEELAQALEMFPALENLDLSELEVSLPEGAFSSNTSLVNVTLPEMTEVSNNLFSGCTSLQSVDIPASVTTIGDGAFSGCSSLTSVNLTGINTIGSGAFSGCDNLTTINILAATGDAPQAIPARAPRKAGVSESAFEGLNPNCFVVLDEGVAMPTAGANVLYTSHGVITEQQADGTTVEREGRIYTATHDVTFNAEYPLAVPHAFTLAEGVSIALTVENGKWSSLVAPFDVEKITDAAGNEVEVTIHNPKSRTVNEDAFYLFTLAEGAEDLESVADVKANAPYLFHVAENGAYTFAATGIKVAATPEEIAVAGKDYTLCATYTAKQLPATEPYILTEDAYAFAPEATDDENVTVKPNTVYATSEVAVPEILTKLPDVQHTTSIDEIDWNGSEMAIYLCGKTLIVFAPEACTEYVYSIDGRTVKALEISAGRNEFDLNLNGVYIVADKKVKF